MAYAFRQISPAQATFGTTTVAGTLASAPVANNLLLFVVANSSINGVATGVSDGTNSATALANSGGVTRHLDIYGYIGTSTATTWTATGPSTAQLNMLIYEFSGAPASITGITDVSAIPAATTTALSDAGSGAQQPSIITTNANDLIITVCVASNRLTTPTTLSSSLGTFIGGVSGTSTADQYSTTAADQFANSGYSIVAATGTYAPIITWSTTTRAVIAITIALKAGVGAVSANQGSTLSMMGVG
jgi:hypothetical protein